MSCPHLFFFFFFNDTATTEIYTLSLHDALPISRAIWITGTLQKLLCRCYICRALWLALPPLETTCCHGFFRGVRKVGRESSALVMENNQHLHFNNQIIKSIYKIYYM